MKFFIQKIVLEDRLLATVFIGYCIFVFLVFFKRKRLFEIPLILLFVLLVLFQLKTTDYKYEYVLSSAQTDLQIQRMNQFPPRLAKLGYLMEAKREIQIFNQWQENLFDILDFKLYFGNYFPYWTIPFFFLGLYEFVKKKIKILNVLLLFTIVILSFVGKNGIYGPFLIFPFILLFIFIGFLKLIRLIKK